MRSSHHLVALCANFAGWVFSCAPLLMGWWDWDCAQSGLMPCKLSPAPVFLSSSSGSEKSSSEIDRDRDGDRQSQREREREKGRNRERLLIRDMSVLWTCTSERRGIDSPILLRSPLRPSSRRKVIPPPCCHRQLDCDLVVGNVLGVRNTQLLRQYCDVDPRFQQLGFAVRFRSLSTRPLLVPRWTCVSLSSSLSVSRRTRTPCRCNGNLSQGDNLRRSHTHVIRGGGRRSHTHVIRATGKGVGIRLSDQRCLNGQRLLVRVPITSLATLNTVTGLNCVEMIIIYSDLLRLIGLRDLIHVSI